MSQVKTNNYLSKGIDTDTFRGLPPLHKEVVTDFFKTVEGESGGIIDRVEGAIELVSDKHNVNTSILYNYIENEVGA